MAFSAHCTEEGVSADLEAAVLLRKEWLEPATEEDLCRRPGKRPPGRQRTRRRGYLCTGVGAGGPSELVNVPRKRDLWSPFPLDGSR